MPGSPLPTSPAGSNFIPRREFAQSVPVPSTYALLTLGGSNYIRLSNFPRSVADSIHAVLDSRSLVRQFKEHEELRLAKFILAGKPWSSPKSIESETLVIELLAAVMASRYTFLSLVDYGKETGDILSLMFSRPITRNSTLASPVPLGLPSTLHVPFGLSFVSSTVVRVINPPLGNTPAILKTVREAWPRGVVSERKVGQTTYEFKLKGYSWLEEDNFYQDSMQHMFTLLSVLSLHGFNLLTSLSFSPGKSGVKDIWIMVGAASPPTPGIHPNNSMPNMPSFHAPVVAHTRNASLDGRPSDLSSVPSRHVRNVTAPSAFPLDVDCDHAASHAPTHAYTDPSSHRSSVFPSRDTVPAVPSPLSKAVPLSEEEAICGAKFTNTDSFYWDDNSQDVPSPLANSPSTGDLSSASPPSPLVTSPLHRVHVIDASSPSSQYVPIEEAPDIRATQILYATPSPPRISPPLQTHKSDISEISTIGGIPGGPPPA